VPYGLFTAILNRKQLVQTYMISVMLGIENSDVFARRKHPLEQSAMVIVLSAGLI
jgi:hypothetical protein